MRSANKDNDNSTGGKRKRRTSRVKARTNHLNRKQLPVDRVYSGNLGEPYDLFMFFVLFSWFLQKHSVMSRDKKTKTF